MSYYKKRSSHLEEKVLLRIEAIEYAPFDIAPPIKVLDCYHGLGEVWSEVAERLHGHCIDVLGIEKNDSIRSPFKVIYGDCHEVIKKLDINDFSIIDVDAYGSPFDMIDMIIKRVERLMLCVYTFNRIHFCPIPKEIRVLDAVDTHVVFRDYIDDMLSSYLYHNGIDAYHQIDFKESGITKRYGYFYVMP